MDVIGRLRKVLDKSTCAGTDNNEVAESGQTRLMGSLSN